MSGGAILIRRQNRLIKAFRDNEALSPDRAINLDDIGERKSFIFRRMLNSGVFVDAGKDQFYMDDAAADEFLIRRRNRIIIFVLIGIAAGVTVGILT